MYSERRYRCHAARSSASLVRDPSLITNVRASIREQCKCVVIGKRSETKPRRSLFSAFAFPTESLHAVLSLYYVDGMKLLEQKYPLEYNNRNSYATYLLIVIVDWNVGTLIGHFINF